MDGKALAEFVLKIRAAAIEECAQVVDRRCEILTLAYRTAKSSHAEGRMDEADSCAQAIRALKGPGKPLDPELVELMKLGDRG